MSSKIIAGTTSGTALNMSADTTGILEIQTGSTPTTAITVDATQNVTLNNVIPSGSTVPANGMFLPTTNSVGFSTASTERMRIDSSGNLLVGTSTPSSFARMTAKGTNAQIWGYGPDITGSAVFRVETVSGTGVYLSAGGTSWTANSDERLKTDLNPIKDAIDKVSTLRAVTGRYKTDKEGTSRSFLIAQEVQKVLPEAVTKLEDEIGTLGVQYTDVIPLLVASIKELNAKVDAQAAEIKALKGVA
jgi:hypothetical protein